MNRHAALLLVGLAACSGDPLRAETEEPPNIVLFLIDDLGWMDLHCQGNERLETPHIDRLAEQGMRFTSAYSAAPVCSPTRAAILTGLSPARLHITTHIPDRFDRKERSLRPAETLNWLPLERVTLAERLKGAGYRNAFLGKWHLSGGRKELPEFYPEHQGFDLNVGGCSYGGPPTYFDPYRIPTIKDRRRGEYLPDRLADEAITFIRANRDRRFFVNLWHYTVHWPMEAKKKHLDKYADRKGPGLKDTRYGAMIEGLDDAVGRILGEIDALGLAERTLVIFTSDNGGYSGVADNRPLRAGKGYLYEGGIRVPMIVRWPGAVPPGSRCDVPVISMDLFPTLLAAAGLSPDASAPMDGKDLTPLLSGSGEFEREALFFHFPNYAWHRDNRLGGAVRQGDYKLIERYDDGSVELYNLAKDLGEKRNLASAMPDKAAALKEKLAAWLAASGARMPRPR